jgi:hypothetical protein
VKRLTRLGPIVVVFAAVGLLVPIASAKIIVGEGIAGIKLGQTEAQVEKVLGKPTPCTEFCNPGSTREWKYPAGFAGIVTFDSHGQVRGMWTGAEGQKTTKGIHANGVSGHGRGSSLVQIKKAYPHAKCSELPHSGGFATCSLYSHYHGRKVETNFLIKAKFAGVAEIAIGFL